MKNSNSTTRRMVMVLLVMLIFGLFSVSAQAQEIKIGLISSLTGPVSTYGQSVRNAVEMGVEEINNAGGINGQKIALVISDDKGDATEAANIARYLIDREQVALIIGPVITPCVMSVAPIAQEAGVPLMTPTGTGDSITAIGDYIFRAAYKDSLQGKVMARFAAENLGLKRVAIMYDIANDYSVGLMNAFKNAFEELGGTIVSTQSYTTGDRDFSAQLTSILLANPEGLYIPDYHSAVGPILLQANQFGINAVKLGVDGWDSPDLKTLSAGNHEGGYYVNHYSVLDTREATVEFTKKYTEKFGQEPDALAALGYDAVLIVKAALEQAGSTDPVAIKDAMGSVKNVVAATATIDMDPEGTPYKPIVVLQIQDGIPIVVDRVYP
ncbi:MAG TPA: ABC transporter substrate-binding protein [Firmicutes bacterium]|nr:ABC transporter substrate-binding protein [Bacillota bacterium]